MTARHRHTPHSPSTVSVARCQVHTAAPFVHIYVLTHFARSSLQERNFVLENEAKNTARELNAERERSAQYERELGEERERGGKVGAGRNELRNECKRLNATLQQTEAALHNSKEEVESLRQKFGAVGSQMEVMLSTEAKDSTDTINALQTKLRAMKDKITEKGKTSKQMEKALRLEIKNTLETLEKSAGNVTQQIQINGKLTSEIDLLKQSTATAIATISQLRTQLTLEDQASNQSSQNNANIGMSVKQQKEHYNERLEDRVRAVTIETEAKTTALCKAKFEKRELEQQNKWLEMQVRGRRRRKSELVAGKNTLWGMCCVGCAAWDAMSALREARRSKRRSKHVP